MKKEKRKESSIAIFYLFLILFFGWILTQFILINQNSLILTENKITGLALQMDPLSGLGNLLSSEIRLGVSGESFPIWIYIATFAMVMSVIFIGARNIAYFQGDEKRGAAIVFSIGITALTVFATNIVSWIAYLAASLGFFLILVLIILLGLDGYFAVHKTVSRGYTELTKVATERETARNALLTSRMQRQQGQPQAQRPGLVRRIFGGGGQQPQQQAPQQRQVRPQQQTVNTQQIKHRLLQNYYIRMQTAHQQTLREINNANPNLNDITRNLNIIKDGSRGIIADLMNSALTGAVVNQVIGLARSINTSSDRMLRIRDVRQLSINYRRGNNMRNWIVNLGRVINNL